jgi:hypothetical protein
VLRYSERIGSGRFGTLRQIAHRPQDDFAPSLAIAGHTVFVAFLHRLRLNYPHTGDDLVRVELASGPLGGVLSPPRAITGYANQDRSPAVVVDLAGDPYLAYFSNRGHRLLIAPIRPGNRLGGAAILSGPQADYAAVAIARDRRGLAAWETADNRIEVSSFIAPRP